MNAAPASAQPVRLAAAAMHCRFEFVLCGDDPRELRAAGEEALGEVRRLDAMLNVYSPRSELARLNAAATDRGVRVSQGLFDLLQCALSLHARTGGGFDPTLGPLVRLWRNAWTSGRLPSPEALREARLRTGLEGLELDAGRTVRFRRSGMEINLNALAKGWALDRAAEVLGEAGVDCALLHGGTSSGRALGAPPQSAGWRIGIADPSEPGCLVETLELRDAGFGMSSQLAQERMVEGHPVGHVIDPASGEPTRTLRAALVVAPEAATADGLSTSLLCRPDVGADWLRPGESGLIVPSTGRANWLRRRS